MHRRAAIAAFGCFVAVAFAGSSVRGQAPGRKRLLFLTHAALYKHPSLAPAEAAVTE